MALPVRRRDEHRPDAAAGVQPLAGGDHQAGLAHYGQAEPIVDLPKPRRERSRARPKPKALDLDIPVFVAEPRTSNALARPALSLSSVGLRLNGERALAAQPKTPSLSGGRRGGE